MWHAIPVLCTLADYHTHTRFGGGRGTVAQNARAARARGLAAVAITEHGPAGLWNGVRDWTRLRAAVAAWNLAHPEPRVLLGVEASVTSLGGDLDVGRKRLDDFDLVLVALHRILLPRSLHDALWMWGAGVRHSPRLRRRARRLATEALCNAVRRHEVDAVAHPGAFGIAVDLEALARAAAARQTAIELSAAHPLLRPGEVRDMRRLGVRFSIGSDARAPEQVGRCEAALELAAAAGLGPSDLITPARRSTAAAAQHGRGGAVTAQRGGVTAP